MNRRPRAPHTDSREDDQSAYAAVRDAIARLAAAYGPQRWWPARSKAEVMIGAVLVQHAAWRNAARAVENLRAARMLAFPALDAAPACEVERLVRPAGAPAVKTRRLKALARFVVDEAGGSTRRLLARRRDPAGALALRARLLGVHGVGPETADAILLYAAGAPTFVVDAYARRVLERHGWAPAGLSYDAVQRLFESALPRDASLYNEAHALLVRVGSMHCKSSAPSCSGCPLQSMLPGATG